MELASGIIIFIVLFVSLTANAKLYISLKDAKKAPQPTTDARELLSHLTSGGAVVRITVLDPESLMLRSPRR